MHADSDAVVSTCVDMKGDFQRIQGRKWISKRIFRLSFFYGSGYCVDCIGTFGEYHVG